jgi:hypothetical protein
MTPFLISAIASLLLFLFVLGMRPRSMEAIGEQGVFRKLPAMLDGFLERRLHIAEPADRWLISVLGAAGVFSLLLFLISLSVLFEEREWPWKFRVLAFAYSHDFGALVFGSFFGIFFGYWLRSIYFRDPKEPTRFSDIVTACIFLFVGLLGIVGPNSLISAFSHLTTLKIAGTELTFSEGRPHGEAGSNDTSLAAIVPPSGSATEAAPPDTSSGLRFLAELPALISRDAAFYYLRVTRGEPQANQPAGSEAMNPELAKTIRALDEARTFAEGSIAPIARCLQRYVAHNGDDSEASDWLTDVARWFRAIQEIQGRRDTLGYNSLPHESWQAMWKVTGQLGQKRQRPFPPSTNDEVCASLYDDIKHPNIVDSDSAKAQEKPKPLTKEEQAEKNRRQAEQDRHKAEFVQHLHNKETRTRPYLAIAAASGLAYGHDYAASLTLLDRWLRAKPERVREIGEELSDVFEIRVRTIMAGYLEEWIRYSPIARTQTVIRYHRNNLETTRELVRTALRKSGFEVGSAETQTKPGESRADFSCTVPGVQSIRSLPPGLNIFKGLTVQKMQLSLWYSLITVERTWIDTMVENQEAYQRGQFETNRVAKQLKDFNYSCLLPLWDGDSRKINIERAASLDSYARVELAKAFSPATKVTATREKRNERLTLALLDVMNGLSMLPEAPNQQSSPSQASADSDDENIFMKQISVDEASEYRDRLTSIKERLQREIANDR